MAKFKYYNGSSWIELLSTAGGQFTGPISFNSTSLPQKTLQYIVGIDAFASGGEAGWESKSDFLSGYATEIWVQNQGYATASSLGTAAALNYTTSVTSGSNALVTSGAVYDAIQNISLPNGPMIFKGTLGTNGTYTYSTWPQANASHEGWTLKVITTNTNAYLKEGDMIVCTNLGTENDPEWTWVNIPSGDEPSGTVTNVATGNGLTGGPITSTGTISLDTAYGDTVNPYGSKTANYVLAAPNGSAGTPSFRALVAADIPDLSGSYLPLTGGTMSGLITTTSSASHAGIKVGDTYINAINGELIFQNNSAIRFGGDSWDYNVWAGLKYDHSNHTIHLGLADNSVFGANSAQSGGILNLPGMDRIQITDVYHRISREDGTTLTRAGGGTISLPNSSGKGIAILADENGDYGLMYVGSDGAMIANSGDTGYVLRVYDKDVSSDMFGVGQSGNDSFFTGNLNVNGTALRLASHATMQYNSTDECVEFVFS